METKQLVIDALNGALQFYAENGGRAHFPEDKVIGYNVETSRIASFEDRHPGWVKLSVQLIEGGGIYFIKPVFTSGICTSYAIAWEEDNNAYNHRDCLKKVRFPELKSKDFHLYIEHFNELKEELSRIVWDVVYKHS